LLTRLTALTPYCQKIFDDRKHTDLKIGTRLDWVN
jgi:hypothetical protein